MSRQVASLLFRRRVGRRCCPSACAGLWSIAGALAALARLTPGKMSPWSCESMVLNGRFSLSGCPSGRPNGPYRSGGHRRPRICQVESPREPAKPVRGRFYQRLALTIRFMESHMRSRTAAWNLKRSHWKMNEDDHPLGTREFLPQVPITWAPILCPGTAFRPQKRLTDGDSWGLR